MRLVQVMVPAGKREAIVDVLEKEGVDYALTDEVSGREYTAVVAFPLPTEAVEPVLESLREAGIERDAYTVVTDAETVISRKFEALQERYAEDEDADRIAREELVARADDLVPDPRSYFVLTVMSAVVATAGLLLDSPAVVVGSMVIAPLVGPAMATGVGTVVGERDLFVQGVRLQALGGLLAVASAGAFAFLLHSSGAVPMTAADVFTIDEVRERLVPDVLSLAVALAAGVAGAISLSTGVSTALVGVMIAAALVPPTAVVGIGLAWGEPTAVVGSAVLVLVNFFSVNFAALGVLWYTGYRPQAWFREDEARRTALRRAAVLLLGILVLSAFLGGVTYASTKTASFEEGTRTAVAEVVAEQEDVRLLSVEVVYDGGFDPTDIERLTLRQPERIVVAVGHQPGVDPPPLAEALARHVAAVAQNTIGPPAPAVEVRYVTVDTATAPGSAPPTPRPPGEPTPRRPARSTAPPAAPA